MITLNIVCEENLDIKSENNFLIPNMCQNLKRLI